MRRIERWLAWIAPFALLFGGCSEGEGWALQRLSPLTLEEDDRAVEHAWALFDRDVTTSWSPAGGGGAL